MLTPDSLTNLVAELGTDRDKAVHSRFTLPLVDDAQLIDAYRGTWIARKVVDLIPSDMTREWRVWNADKADIAKLEAAERRHRLKAKWNDAMRWARLYGGAALIIGAADGEDDLARPLNPRRIGRDGLRYVQVVTRHKLAPGQIVDDIESDAFGQPGSYMLHAGHRQAQLHHSRVIPLVGADRPPEVAGANDGWGDSVLVPVWQAALNATSGSAVIASLLLEAKIDVVQVPDLSSHLATQDGRDRLLRRFSLAAMMKSINNMLMLGEGEVHTQKQINFAGLPDIHIRFLQEAAGAADIPVTRLMGQSPAGLNATGESDMRMYYDMIRARQHDDMAPALERIDELLMRSALGARPDDIYYEFPSLWQMTPQQQAETNLKNAQAFQIDVNSGIHDERLLRRARSNQIIETGAYPGWEGAEQEIEEENKANPISFEEPGQEAEGMPPTVGEAPPEDQALNGAQILAIKGIVEAVGQKLLPPETAVQLIRVSFPMISEAQAREIIDPMKSFEVVVTEIGNAVRDAASRDAAPRTLYVSRKVKNAAQIIAWAKAQGFTSTLPADDLHVTVAFSRRPVDWMKAGEDFGDNTDAHTVPAGGPRLVEPLGDKGAVVLMFNSWVLAYRHGRILQAGASWDHPEYQPHITLTYEGAPADLHDVVPYRGPIELGPEVFEEVSEDWEKGLREAKA